MHKVLCIAEQLSHHYLKNNSGKVCEWSEHCSKSRELKIDTLQRDLFLFAQTCITCDSHITVFGIVNMRNSNFVRNIHGHQ